MDEFSSLWLLQRIGASVWVYVIILLILPPNYKTFPVKKSLSRYCMTRFGRFRYDLHGLPRFKASRELCHCRPLLTVLRLHAYISEIIQEAA